MKKPSTDTSIELPCAASPAMPALRSIALTCDFMRFSFSARGVDCGALCNLDWIEQLLGLQTRAARYGISVRRIVPPLAPAEWAAALGDDSVLQQYHEHPELAWARHCARPDTGLFAAQFAALTECDLVVGFELPKGLRQHLHAHGRRYLSLRVHPLRFLRDLCFGMATNCQAIAAAAADCVLPQAEVDTRVRWMHALFAHARHPSFAMPAELPLLVGQTAADSVLVRDGRFVTWAEHEDEILDRLAGHAAVGLLPHPHDHDPQAWIRLVQRRWGKTVVHTDANSYGVLCSNRHTPVVLALASSLAVEADALGLPAHFLHGHPSKVDALPDIEAPTEAPLGHGLLLDRFWNRVLGAPDATTMEPGDAFALGEHHLRNSLEAWAFGALRYGLVVGPIRKTVWPASPMSAAQRLHLVRGLAGPGAAQGSDANAILNMARQQGLHLAVLESPLACGEQRHIDFSDPASAQYLAAGFAQPQAAGVCNTASTARLVVPALAAPQDLPAQVVAGMRVSWYPEQLGLAPVLRIGVAGQAVACLSFGPDVSAEQRVEIRIPTQGDDVVIDFHLSNARPDGDPASAGEEGRAGFRLIELDLALESVVTDAGPGSASLQGPGAVALSVPMEGAAA